MLKFITFAKLTEKGQLMPPEKAPAVLAKVLMAPEKAPAVLAKVQEIVRTYGGKVEYMWATIGRYDFVSFAEYPSEESAFKARTKITELGLFHLESTIAFPVETYIEALAEEKVLVTV